MPNRSLLLVPLGLATVFLAGHEYHRFTAIPDCAAYEEHCALPLVLDGVPHVTHIKPCPVVLDRSKRLAPDAKVKELESELRQCWKQVQENAADEQQQLELETFQESAAAFSDDLQPAPDRKIGGLCNICSRPMCIGTLCKTHCPRTESSVCPPCEDCAAAAQAVVEDPKLMCIGIAREGKHFGEECAAVWKGSRAWCGNSPCLELCKSYLV